MTLAVSFAGGGNLTIIYDHDRVQRGVVSSDIYLKLAQLPVYTFAADW